MSLVLYITGTEKLVKPSVLLCHTSF